MPTFTRPLIVLILILVVSLFFASTPANGTWGNSVQITTLTNGTSNAGLEFPPQHRAFYAAGDHWVFYVGPNGPNNCESASTCIYYACSHDGQTWTITATAFMGWTREYSVYQTGSSVYLARYDSVTEHSPNHLLLFDQGALNGVTCTINWGTERTVKAASTNLAWDYPAIALDSNSQAYVLYDQNNPQPGEDTSGQAPDFNCPASPTCTFTLGATAANAGEFAVFGIFNRNPSTCNAAATVSTITDSDSDTISSIITRNTCLSNRMDLELWGGIMVNSGAHTFTVTLSNSGSAGGIFAGGTVIFYSNVAAAIGAVGNTDANSHVSVTLNPIAAGDILTGTVGVDVGAPNCGSYQITLTAPTTPRQSDSNCNTNNVINFASGDQQPSSTSAQTFAASGWAASDVYVVAAELVRSGTIWAIRSAGTNYASWTADTQLNATNSVHWRGSITPLTSGKVYAAYTTSFQGPLWGNLYNGAWQSIERISPSAPPGPSTNEVYLFNSGGNDQVSAFYQGTDNTIRSQIRDTSGVWRSIFPNSTLTTVTPPQFDSFTISYDAMQDLFYVFNYDVPNNRIALVTGTFAKGWSSATTIFSPSPLAGSTTADNIASEPTITYTGNGAAILGIVYTTGTTASTTNLVFALDTIPASSTGGEPPPNQGPPPSQPGCPCIFYNQPVTAAGLLAGWSKFNNTAFAPFVLIFFATAGAGAIWNLNRNPALTPFNQSAIKLPKPKKKFRLRKSKTRKFRL